ncbi:MAG: metallophosphoesterase [Candidatus Diapherotrites archaeon]|nr:metallophosphoesterase [Candidatus Diapherotrites archaeon]
MDSKQKQVVEFAAGKNILLDLESTKILSEQENFEEIIDSFLKENKTVLNAVEVNERINSEKTKIEPQEKIIVKKTRFNSIAKDSSSNLKILTEFDVTNQSNSSGKVENFLSLFRDKYTFLKGVLSKRSQLNAKPLSRLSKVPEKSEFDTIAMIQKKWITKNQHIAFIIEDTETQCIAIISNQNAKLFEEGNKILLDDVIGIKGTKISNEMIIVNEFFWPELESRPLTKPEQDLDVLIISDTHVGSKLFLEKEFNKFLNWLNCNDVSEKEKERIGKIKYLMMVGDNVDGIGVYPNQYDELEIKDLFEQYNKLEQFLLKIPEHIEIVMIPGQHDAVRRAEPQTAIPEKFFPEMSKMNNFHLIGNPSWIEIEGLKTVLYHGASLHDLYDSLSFLSPLEPHKGIIELLKRRDLMPSYGMRNPYVPEKKDFMLIREEPDLYFGGDMHHVGYGQYKSCMVINSATWQKRTEFQIAQGHVPTPGIAIQLELTSRKITEHKFMSAEEEE